MSGSGQAELQQLSQQLQEVETRIDALENQLQTLQARNSDLQEAMEAIEELDTGSTVQVPIGGNAYVRATVEDMDEIIVGLGSGYATEQSEADALSLLEDRREQLEDRIETVTEELEELQSQGEELGARAQQHLAEQEQQRQSGG